MNPTVKKGNYRVMDEKEVFKCEECGLHYNEKATAQQCETFCKENNACSMDITKHSIESNRKVDN